jgi:hypothetical protein
MLKISLFLSAVKKQSPDTKVSIIMIDDNNAGWNAARSVYGSGLQQLLVMKTFYKHICIHITIIDSLSVAFGLLFKSIEIMVCQIL